MKHLHCCMWIYDYSFVAGHHHGPLRLISMSTVEASFFEGPQTWMPDASTVLMLVTPKSMF